MKTYQEQKNEYLNSILIENEDIYRARLEGFEMAEKLIEGQIRNNISPLAGFLQTISQIVDTKKESKRESLLSLFSENHDQIKRLKDNINKLINIVRL